MSTALSPFNASVTRVLELQRFPSELKTKDIQGCFTKWEDVRIKWVDDTTALVIFTDAVNAKRAYLHMIAHPPATLTKDTDFKIRPYDKEDSQQIIHQVYSRHQPRRQSVSHAHQHSHQSSTGAIGIGLAGGPVAQPPPAANHARRPSESLPPYNLESQFGLPPLHKQQSLQTLISSSIPFNVPNPEEFSVPNREDFQPPPSTSTAIPIVKPDHEQEPLDPKSEPFVPHNQ